MKIALAGLPQSGKTTIFNALTRCTAVVGEYRDRNEPNLAIVEVNDERVQRLSKIYSPEKTTFASMEITDLGAVEGGGEKQDIDETMLRVLKNSNALGLILRNFDSPLSGPAAPLDDLSRINEILIFSDLLLADTRLQRIESMLKKGQRTPQISAEQQTLEKIHTHLENSKPIRALEPSDPEKTAIRGLQFLTDKPTMFILNSSEATFGKNDAMLERIGVWGPVIEFAGTFEMELAQLRDDEAVTAFMADIGIPGSARERLTRCAYELLGYISFFTVGSDEVRAWNLRRCDSALDAAAAIHTDLARGFIRAECFHYNDLIELGNEKAVKEKGRLRLEGRNYVVKDGDVLSIRFNV